jgi:RNA recognition motif-containing protein
MLQCSHYQLSTKQGKTLSILVRNLPKSFTQENLEDLFFEFGTITSCDLVMDDASGLSKGFGFVEMSTQEETDKAIERLNAKVIDGKKIRVKWSNQEKKQAAAIDSTPAPKRDIPDDVWGTATRNNSERENDAE